MSGTDTRIADNTPVQDGWRLLRVDAGPEPSLTPGQWLHIATADDEAAVAVYRFHAGEGWWAALIPPNHRLAALRPGTRLSICGVHGSALPQPDGDTVMLGTGQGVGPMLAIAESAPQQPRLVCLGDPEGLPVRTCPSRFVVPHLPGAIMAGVAPLEAVGVAARVAIPGERPGCYDGDTVELLWRYLAGLAEDGGEPPKTLLAAAPWRSLVRWHDEFAARFQTIHLLELPDG